MFGGPRFAATAFGAAQNVGSITLTTQEIETLNQDAENKFKDKLDEFYDILRLFKTQGADYNLQVKKPLKPKTPQQNEEELEDTDLDYGFAAYFETYRSRILQAIQSKIDVLPTDVIPENVGNTLLHIASSSSYLPLYKFLVEEVKIDVNIQNVHGENELFRVVKNGHNTDEFSALVEYLATVKISTEQENLKHDTALLVAARGNKLLLLKKLLALGVNPDRQNINGEYALLSSVKNKSLSAVEALLTYKANPNLVDENKRTSIHWAINLSNADADASNEIENCLLSSGADLNAVDSRGRTPLHYAFVKIGDPFNTSNIDPIETVSNILSREGVSVAVRDTWGNTALNYAAQRGSIISGLYLLKHGSDINNVNNDGNTPLNECLINGHQNMCIFLIQKEADLTIPVKVRTAEAKKEELAKKIEEEKKKKAEQGQKPANPAAMDVETPKENVEFESSDEEETRHQERRKVIDNDSEDEAAQSDNEDEDAAAQANGMNPFGSFGGKTVRAPRKVLKGGFGVPQPATAEDTLKFKKTETECSTFSIAIRRNWQSVAFLMLEFGFNLSLAILDCFTHKKYNYVYTLLLKKADSGVYQTTNAQRKNLTHLFAQNASKISTELYEKILGKLEAKNLDFKSTDDSNRTSLHYACQSGSIRLVRTLLEKGLDINSKDNSGVHPLGHVLTKSFHVADEFAILGKTYNLDLNSPFFWKGVEHTALTYIVAEQKNIQTFSKLHEFGADVNKGDSNGFTPLIHYVRQNKLIDLQSLLRDFKIDVHKSDNDGRNIIHHVVKSHSYASYENVDMLNYLAPLTDINKADNKGFTPLDYAHQQESGRMKAALEKLGARANQASIRRQITSMLNELEFPDREYNFEEDFEKFLEECKTKADTKKQQFNEKIPVDHNAVGNYEVVYENGEPFDTYMVKVEISYGYYSGNTFYKMQILREKVRDIYILFTKWGRVGTDGQYQQTPFSKLDDAKKEWCSIFKSKSGNLWEDRHNFVKNSKKYRLVPFVQRTKMEDYIKAFNYKDSRIPQPTITKELYKLIRRVCNYKILANALTGQYRFDNTILPLHLLTKERIEDARAVVTSLEKTIKAYEDARKEKQLEKIQSFAEELTSLTSEFYELIPSSNHKDRAIPPIYSSWMLQNVQKLINDLGYFEIVIKLIGAATLNMYRINPVDYCYKCLGFKIAALDVESDEFKILRKYMKRGAQGQSIKGQIHNIYAVERERERDNIKKWEKYGNKMLLWHGTKPENVVGILQTGFRIAPADTSQTGAMFGSGVYFADMFGKSAQYANSNNFGFGFGNNQQSVKAPKKYLFLCEVALGSSKSLYNSEAVTGLPDGSHQSVKGIGRVGPNPAENLYLPNGVIVPLGSQMNNLQPEPEKPTNPSPFGGFHHSNFYWALQFNNEYLQNPNQTLKPQTHSTSTWSTTRRRSE